MSIQSYGVSNFLIWTCVASYVAFCLFENPRLKVLHFWLDSCIANNGEKFELEMAYWMHLECFQVVSSHFWALVCTGLTGQSASHVHMLHTGWPVVLTGLTGQGWVVAAALFQVVFCMHSSRGSCIGSGGACKCAGEPFVVFQALVWWFALFA
jgi:hypothetical protein